MKIAKDQLRKIISSEIRKMLKEQSEDNSSATSSPSEAPSATLAENLRQRVVMRISTADESWDWSVKFLPSGRKLEYDTNDKSTKYYFILSWANDALKIPLYIRIKDANVIEDGVKSAELGFDNDVHGGFGMSFPLNPDAMTSSDALKKQIVKLISEHYFTI